jgi:hypothetical protein
MSHRFGKIGDFKPTFPVRRQRNAVGETCSTPSCPLCVGHEHVEVPNNSDAGKFT